MVEVDIAAFDIPEVTKTLTKSRVVRPFFFSAPCMPQDANPRDPACLRVRRPW